ncbi:transposase InsO family protein [Rathayibacter agropyri]
MGHLTYLATVIDVYSRKLVGWSLDTHLRTTLITDALTNALQVRKPTGRVIFHSDRGTRPIYVQRIRQILS